MVHKRSGAQRRSARNALRRGQAVEAAEAMTLAPARADSGTSKIVNTVASASLTEHCAGVVRGRLLIATSDCVITAVESLYADGLEPIGRLLRKRIAERHVCGDFNAELVEEHIPEVDMQHLRSVCEKHTRLIVESGEGGDWSVSLVGCKQQFVDIYSSVDDYPEEMWLRIQAYFSDVGDNFLLPGGRYSCARALLARRLPFFEGRSLGEVCHIVQLAMTQRKVLGYSKGAIVPYNHSQSRLKELYAGRKQACELRCEEAADLPCATWEQATDCLRKVLAEAAAGCGGAGHGAVPLSGVKRIFRLQFALELSETVLGHSKLSELLQDVRFAEVCVVKLDERGYIVMQRTESITETLPEAQCLLTPSPRCSLPIVCDVEDANQADICELDPTTESFVPSHVSPVLAPAEKVVEKGSGVVQRTAVTPSVVMGSTDGFSLPSSSEHQLMLGDMLGSETEVRNAGFCLEETLCLEDAGDVDVDVLIFDPTPGPFGPSPAPQMQGASTSDWECGRGANYLQDLLPVYLDDFQRVREEAWQEPCAGQFCADEPLCLEDVCDSCEGGLLFDSTPGPFGPTPAPLVLPLSILAGTSDVSACNAPLAHGSDSSEEQTIAEEHTLPFVVEPRNPVTPRAPSWPAVSPWKDFRLGHLVQNTFIHVAAPLSPLPGTLRRAVSLGTFSDSTTATSPTDKFAKKSTVSSALSSPREVDACTCLKADCVTTSSLGGGQGGLATVVSSLEQPERTRAQSVKKGSSAPEDLASSERQMPALSPQLPADLCRIEQGRKIAAPRFSYPCVQSERDSISAQTFGQPRSGRRRRRR
eukprot:TRINITY_DN12108_c0_g2_i1.p1 TRINITY_DN12108_c0_g2~~TRINITY_DN12108_c0_g2_i1.p1  ORF type:complete len:831 (+),score=93.63 TRINITY_DN12108_c0_g2_i1:50-2494(+)